MSTERIEMPDDIASIIDREAGHTAAVVRAPAAEAPAGVDVVEGLNGGKMWRIQDTEEGRKRAAEMQEKSRGKYREARELRKKRSSEEAAAILEEVGESITTSTQGGRPTSIPKMSDDIVRMMGALIRNGGPMFAPTSAKEASDIAKQWATIGASYRTGRAMDKITEATASEAKDSPATEVVRHLAELKTRLEMQKASQAAQPGQVRQIAGPDDDDDSSEL